MTVFMNHEIPAGNGIARAHGQNGAFVSDWTIHLNTLQAKWGSDLIQNVYTWDTATSQDLFNPTAQFSRFCSADLPAYTAFYNPATGRGFDGRIFMNGEEIGDRGSRLRSRRDRRRQGHLLSAAVPRAFLMGEHRCPSRRRRQDHRRSAWTTAPTGQVYVYVGNKRTQAIRSSRPVSGRGTLRSQGHQWRRQLRIRPVISENNGAINGTFVLTQIYRSSQDSLAAVLQTFSVAAGITEFARPEDGAWDTSTRGSSTSSSTGGHLGTTAVPITVVALYNLTSTASGIPTGGAIELIVETARALNPPAFRAIVAHVRQHHGGRDGSVSVQEDPGGNDYIAKTWRVNPATKVATEILHSDPARFVPPTPPPFNVDEESSGIIEVTDIVRSANWYEKAGATSSPTCRRTMRSQASCSKADSFTSSPHRSRNPLLSVRGRQRETFARRPRFRVPGSGFRVPGSRFQGSGGAGSVTVNSAPPAGPVGGAHLALRAVRQGVSRWPAPDRCRRGRVRAISPLDKSARTRGTDLPRGFLAPRLLLILRCGHRRESRGSGSWSLRVRR